MEWRESYECGGEEEKGQEELIKEKMGRWLVKVEEENEAQEKKEKLKEKGKREEKKGKQEGKKIYKR